MSSPYSTTVMFLPTSSTPPIGIIRILPPIGGITSLTFFGMTLGILSRENDRLGYLSRELLPCLTLVVFCVIGFIIVSYGHTTIARFQRLLNKYFPYMICFYIPFKYIRESFRRGCQGSQSYIMYFFWNKIYEVRRVGKNSWHIIFYFFFESVKIFFLQSFICFLSDIFQKFVRFYIGIQSDIEPRVYSLR